MEQENLRPKKRSRLRLLAGQAYYTAMRHVLWHSGKFRFAALRSDEALPYTTFSHQSPLLRKLRDVDMQYQYNKITNLRLAVPTLDGMLLRPGETLSYWRCIGHPTRRRGYVEGMVLFCGSFGPGVGGGLCQLSNLIYWLTLHTPLTVTERYRHSFDVFPDTNRTVPFGSGATCVYPYRDLMITNNTQNTYQLHVWLDGEFLHGEWRCTQPPQSRFAVVESHHEIRREYWGQYSRHNVLCKQEYDLNGTLLHEEVAAENHALMMYAPFLPQSTQPCGETQK